MSSAALISALRLQGYVNKVIAHLKMVVPHSSVLAHIA